MKKSFNPKLEAGESDPHVDPDTSPTRIIRRTDLDIPNTIVPSEKPKSGEQDKKPN